MNELKGSYSGFRFCRSVTTRDMRPGETEGESYFFVQRDEYDGMDRNGELIESVEYLGNKYGTRYDEINNAIENGENLIMILQAHGMYQIKEHYKNDCVCVFMLPPSMKELRKRLVNRGRETPEQIEERMKNAKNEISTSIDYDYLVVNDVINHCANKIYNYVKESAN